MVAYGTRAECSRPQKCIGSRAWSTAKILLSSLLFIVYLLQFLFLFNPSQFPVPGKRLIGPDWVRDSPCLQSCQRRQSHRAQWPSESCGDRGSILRKAELTRPWNSFSVACRVWPPPKGYREANMWCSVCWSGMVDVLTVWLQIAKLRQERPETSLRPRTSCNLMAVSQLRMKEKEEMPTMVISSLSNDTHSSARKSCLVINWNSNIQMVRDIYNIKNNVQWNITESQTGLWFHIYLGA